MMKQFFSFRNLALFSAMLFGAVVFSACNKNKEDVPQTPAAGLMAFNLAPDQPAVNVVMSNNLLGGAALNYGSYTGTYLNIYAGDRQVNAYSASNDDLLDSVTYAFKQDKYYSVFVTGTNGNYKNVIVEDNYDSLTASAGKAYVRYVNAVADVPSVTVNFDSQGASVLNTTAQAGTASQFIAVDPGDVSISVAGESGVNASRTITLQAQKAYTVLLMGQAGATDSTTAAQIRFIENGTVTD